jgi:carbon-monoxide dehydrogenase medium subunit
MRAFEVFSAKDSQHAVALLAQHAATSKVKVLAGGTDLLADLKFAPSSHAPAVVVDISRVDDFRGIKQTKEGLSIGALVTHAMLERSPEVARHVPLLAQAVPHVAHPAIRNRGTHGGSHALADPAAVYPASAARPRCRKVTGPNADRVSRRASREAIPRTKMSKRSSRYQPLYASTVRNG